MRILTMAVLAGVAVGLGACGGGLPSCPATKVRVDGPQAVEAVKTYVSKTFGAEEEMKAEPFTATADGPNWDVRGATPAGYLSGGYQAKVDGATGCVLSVSAGSGT